MDRTLKPNLQWMVLIFLSVLKLDPISAKPEYSETPHWSNDIPGFYHRLFFNGGEFEVRAHLRGLTAVHDALPERGTSSLRVCNGKVLVNSFFLDSDLVSCRLETDPVEIAEFYRSLTDDFNCAQQKKAESSAAKRRNSPHHSSKSSKSKKGNARHQAQTNSKDSFGVADEEAEISDEFDEADAGITKEPLWCSIEDPIGRQIWNETFALIVNDSDQRGIMQEIRKLLRFRVQKKQCQILQKKIRRNALRDEEDSESGEVFPSSEDEEFTEVLPDQALRARRARRSIFSSIMPGTKWCGSGNHAASFNELGASAKTDDCCREHDQCPYTLVSFQKRWGLRNKSFFTVSHCRCDERFRSCLKMARTSQSRFVGRMFFDLLSKQCFVFKKVRGCARLSWDGSRCIRKKWTKRAILRDGMSYY